MTPSLTEKAEHAAFDAVLLDFDGTVVDTLTLILASYRHTMIAHTGQAPPDTVWLAGMGTPLRTQLRALARDDGEAAAMLKTYVDHSRDFHDELAKTFEGMRDVLDTLHGRVPIGIVTSKARRGVERSFDAFDLGRYFDPVITADDVEEHKPSPVPVRTAAALLNVEPALCLMVGDSPHDIAAGRAAGATTAAAGWGAFDVDALRAAEPDHWLPAPAALCDLVFGRRG